MIGALAIHNIKFLVSLSRIVCFLLMSTIFYTNFNLNSDCKSNIWTFYFTGCRRPYPQKLQEFGQAADISATQLTYSGDKGGSFRNYFLIDLWNDLGGLKFHNLDPEIDRTLQCLFKEKKDREVVIACQEKRRALRDYTRWASYFQSF